MGLLARALHNTIPVAYPAMQQWGSTPQQSYPGYARAYMNNEIVFAAIEMLASSAGEPKITGRRLKRQSPQIRNEESRLLNLGVSRADIKRRMVANGYFEELPNHPLILLLNKPNPFMSRGQLWGTVVMDRSLAGNAYLLKARVQNGPLKGKVQELWRLRPDRVKIIPSASNFIEGYEYNIGRDKIVYPAADVMHFKTRNPLNDYYGMPPLMAATGRLSIDEYMENFLRSFYERGGAGPGSVLSVKQKLNQEQKDQIRDRFKAQFGGSAGFHELMVIDSNEHTYTQMGLNRGLRDALPKELDAVTEARIAMIFGIPGSILGLLIGYESSSYANKRQDWQVFWDLTMTPLLSDLDDVLNLSLVPEFGMIDEVGFDLSDIRALQEDVDKIMDRHRANFQAGGISRERFLELIGEPPDESAGIVYVPRGVVPTEVKLIGTLEAEQAANPPPPKQIAAPANIVEEVHCPKCGRWVGRNMNVGATAYCPKDKEVLVVEPSEPKVISINVIRDEEGRVASLVGGE